MMLRFRGTSESFDRIRLLSFSVNTKLMKASGFLAMTRRDAVVMELESRLSKPIEIGVAREALDFEIELRTSASGFTSARSLRPASVFSAAAPIASAAFTMNRLSPPIRYRHRRCAAREFDCRLRRFENGKRCRDVAVCRRTCQEICRGAAKALRRSMRSRQAVERSQLLEVPRGA